MPMYHDEPARSHCSTVRNQRGTGGAGLRGWDVIVSSSVGRTPSGSRPDVTAAITREVVEPTALLRDTGVVTATSPAPFGTLMRQWRQRRRLSQLDLALEANVSSRHVSFIETGRSSPSRAMVLRLADALDVPLREQNQLLLAAGLAPVHAERPLDDPEMAPVREGVHSVLAAYEPYPCLAVDRGWRIVAMNAGAGILAKGVAEHLLESPNALRLSLHPEGLAPRIRNLGQWRHHVIGRLRREVAASRSDELAALLAEIEAYPGGFDETRDLGGVVVPLVIEGADGVVLTFLSTVTTFGTALDLTAAELSIEAFLPADDVTAAALRSSQQLV
jgi:transcriptional regulator with XRE-family HTH domain